jgi:hypothetical protein
MLNSVVLLSLASPLRAQAPAARPPQQTGPQAPGAAPAGFEGSAYRKAAEIPARIMSFTAEPSSIQPGQPAVLNWATENPSGVTIEPGIGRVLARGSEQIIPTRTTTYTLTVRGPNNAVLTRTVTVNVAGTTPLPADAPLESRQVPRLNGKPDFSGVYSPAGGRNARGASSEQPVLKAGAEKYRVVRGPDDAGFFSNCMPVVGPQALGVYQFQLVQGANFVVIMDEYPGTFRIIPTHGGPQPADPDYTWLGNSIGRWEGDTLVVDTVGFNEKTEIQGYMHSDALHIVERFSRPTFDTIEYDITTEDPNVWEKPWTVHRTFTLRTDEEKISEFICENNRDYRPLFGK